MIHHALLEVKRNTKYTNLQLETFSEYNNISHFNRYLNYINRCCIFTKLLENMFSYQHIIFLKIPRASVLVALLFNSDEKKTK
jgi:hypothetical protein